MKKDLTAAFATTIAISLLTLTPSLVGAQSPTTGTDQQGHKGHMHDGMMAADDSGATMTCQQMTQKMQKPLVWFVKFWKV